MLKPQGRVDLWEEVFLPPPAELVDLITKEVRDKIAREGLADEVLRHLKVSQWKGAEAVYKTKAADAKRDWNEISGEVWGSKKGQSWTPTNWRSEFEGITPMEAESNLESGPAKRSARSRWRTRSAKASRSRPTRPQRKLRTFKCNTTR